MRRCFGPYCGHQPPCRTADNFYEGDGDGPRAVNPKAARAPWRGGLNYEDDLTVAGDENGVR